MTEAIYWAALGFAGGWLSCSVFAGLLARTIFRPEEERGAGMAWKDRRE